MSFFLTALDKSVREHANAMDSCFLSTKPDEVFPKLKELIIILRPGPLGVGFDDLYEVNTSTSTHLKSAMEDVVNTFKDAQSDGALKGVTLKFMRTEKWAN